MVDLDKINYALPVYEESKRIAEFIADRLTNNEQTIMEDINADKEDD